MSPIQEVSERMPEIGRIRMGAVEERKGKRVPRSLETWRLTSSHLEALARAAELWGGTVSEWTPERGGGHGYEVTTETDTLPVMVPPQDIAASQYLESYTAAGLIRRCDGQTELLSDGPCLCARESDRSCLPTTRLRVVLPDLPGLGQWLLVSRGWSAASELQGSVALIASLTGTRGVIPAAELVLDQRTRIAEGETKHFTVPTLRLPYALRDLQRSDAADLSQLTASEPAIETPTRPEVAQVVDAAREDGSPEVEPPAPSSGAGPSSRRRYPKAASSCSHVNAVDAEGRCVDCGKPLVSA